MSSQDQKSNRPNRPNRSNRSKVFIVNRSGHNYAPAERYGDLVFLTEGTVDRYNTNHMYRIFAEAFDSASPEDYILLTSLSILCSMACSVFARRYGRLNILLYRNGKYIERRHNLDQLLNDVEPYFFGSHGDDNRRKPCEEGS